VTMETIIPPSQKAAPESEDFLYGGVSVRFLALCLDTFGIFVVIFLLFLPLFIISLFASVILMPLVALFNLTLFPSFFLLFAMTHWIYFATMESSARGATYGKRLFGLRVVDEKGQALSFARASLRYFAKFVSAVPLFLGFVMAFVTQRKQALHDLIAETVVVKG